ncbi:alpha/beta-hydrolase [Mollisia scopiformis]|uniref:Alpha/beta-hydrolase n=1 Tax=Mollisia scopiformis TaxID=149040 RepID=A0A132B7M1_MOLSC|nr:alpha/beta-hydrolase [Mollisia scopiformis]KUJ08395.1 alpha/beta-hydrolase [Mollisia scopiformis]
MPGFSQTTGPTALIALSLRKIATQITELMAYLRIPAAAFWGCSSGGLAALAILKFYPERVRNIVIHEVPFGAPDFVYALKEQSDEAVVSSCRVLFRDAMVGDPEAWDALGEEYHERLEKNYVTWIRHYAGVLENENWEAVVKDNTKRISWSVGGQSHMAFFFENVVLASKCGIDVQLLDCKHFPQVTLPDKLAQWIKSCCEKAEANCCFNETWD